MTRRQRDIVFTCAVLLVVETGALLVMRNNYVRRSRPIAFLLEWRRDRAIREATQAESGIIAPFPAVVLDADARRWTATIREGSHLTVVYGGTKWGTFADSVVTVPPCGDVPVRTLLRIDCPADQLPDYQSAWEQALVRLEAARQRDAHQLGLSEAPLRVRSEVFVEPYVPLANEEDPDVLRRHAESVGVITNESQVSVVINLACAGIGGGLARTDTKSIALGCFNCDDGVPEPSDAKKLDALAWAAYVHELGHLLGWQHGEGRNWPGFRSHETLPAAAALFGWTDEDGDGIVEACDPTPHGMGNR